MRNREFVFTPKIEYKLVAEPHTRASSVRDKLPEANQNSLTFPVWCFWQESNLHHLLRREIFYPLNYRSVMKFGRYTLTIPHSKLEEYET